MAKYEITFTAQITVTVDNLETIETTDNRAIFQDDPNEYEIVAEKAKEIFQTAFTSNNPNITIDSINDVEIDEDSGITFIAPPRAPVTW